MGPMLELKFGFSRGGGLGQGGGMGECTSLGLMVLPVVGGQLPSCLSLRDGLSALVSGHLVLRSLTQMCSGVLMEPTSWAIARHR